MYKVEYNSKKLHDFSKKYPELDTCYLIESYIDCLERVMNENKSIKTDDLEVKINEIMRINELNKMEMKTEMEQIKNKIYESGTQYINEIRILMESKNSNNLLNFNEISEKTTNKLILNIEELIGKNLPEKIGTSMLSMVKSELENVTNNLNLNNNVEKRLEEIFNNLSKELSNIGSKETLYEIKNMSNETRKIQEDMNDKFTSYINKYKTAPIKGNIGELKLAEIISREFPTFELSDTRAENMNGDFILHIHEGTPILIETKEYDYTSVPKKEVDKFIRDIRNMKYNGIMFSHNSGITGKNDYQLDVDENKVLLYIHNTNYDPIKIRNAINIVISLGNIINTREKKDNNYIIGEDVLKKINSEFDILMATKSRLIDNLKEYYKKSMFELQKINSVELEETLSKYFCRTTKFQCKYCNKMWHNTMSLNKHIQKCPKAPKYKLKNETELKDDIESNIEIDEFINKMTERINYKSNTKPEEEPEEEPDVEHEIRKYTKNKSKKMDL